MRARLLHLPMVRGYAVGLALSAVPILLISIGVWFYLGRVGGQVDDFTAQVQAVSGGSAASVKSAEIVAPSFTNIVPVWAIVVFVIVMVGAAFLQVVFVKPTNAMVTKLVGDARAVAGGDLRPESEVTFGNEYGKLQASMGRMIGGFRTTVGRIDTASAELREAAAEMARTSDEAGNAIAEVAQSISAISEGASHQVDLVTRSGSVVREIEGQIRDATEHASEAQRQSAETEKLAEEGLASASEVEQAMQSVREGSLVTSEVIRSLGEKSADINQIVHAITDIAAQTNMLALNASIEAARAGDQGRGFANVAEEVRVLAEDAQSSAEQIAALVREIRLQTEQAVEAMEDGAVRVEEGFETVNRNRQTFFDISGAVRTLAASSNEIGELSEGIARGTRQVREQIEQVASVAEHSSASTQEVSASTQQTSAAAEEVSASAQKVAHTAAAMAELSARFQLPTDGASGA